MRTISTDDIIQTIKEMCIEVNYDLSTDMKQCLQEGKEKEESTLGKDIFSLLEENLSIAKKEQIPICQDTGMAIVFLRIGQQLHIEGMLLEDAVNEGIRQGYEQGYLRKSVVADPLRRTNTTDNTPGIIHYQVVEGDQLEIILAPKGFGSENMSRVCMLKPADGAEGVMQAVVDTVREAGPNACPPVVVGVGIGGSFEKCAVLAKQALTRELTKSNPDPFYQNMEKEILTRINKLGIGPAGLGGRVTALGVNIEVYPTHIAGLPVAVNMCCHVNRHIRRIL